MMNSMIFDFKEGILLKLGENKEILVALRGRKVMSSDEIKKIYGEPVPIFKHVDWPYMSKFTDDVMYHGFNTQFNVVDYVPLLMGVELIDQGLLDKSYLELKDDILNCLND